MNTAAHRFIAAMFRPDDLIELRLIKPGRGNRVEQRWCRADAIDEHLPWAESLNAEGYGVYVGANARTRHGGAAADVAPPRTFFVDFDGCPLDLARQRCDEAGLPAPTAIIRTGRPDGGYHFWWLLDDPIVNLSQWSGIEAAIVQAVDGDSAAKDAPRVLRLPGFRNTKHDGLPVATIVELTAERTYPIDEFTTTGTSPGKSGGNNRKRATNTKPKRRVKKADVRKASSCLARLKPERADGYADWLAVAMACHSADSSDAMFDRWNEWSAKSDKYVDTADCRKTWDSLNGDGRDATQAEKDQGLDGGTGRIKVGLGTLVAVANEDDSGGAPSNNSPYRATRLGLTWDKPTKDGSVPVPLTNFNARIVADVIRDDGQETTHVFEIEARVCREGHPARTFTVPATRLPGMGWAVENLGASALLFPGFAVKDHARAAIQTLSFEGQKRRHIHTHTGWLECDGDWVYLHSGGAVGKDGLRDDIQTDLPGAITPVELPTPPEGDDLHKAVQASLRLLELADDRITVPIFAAIYRSVLNSADFAIHLAGVTGSFKTEIATLAQRHFGTGFNNRNLPGSWSSTGNSLEILAFSAKDMVLVVDDFAPSGSSYDIARTHREADRLIRAQGNRSGRGRLRADGTLRPTKSPRGLILSTGEDIPRGESLRARLPVIWMEGSDINVQALTRAQADADAGLYAGAMAAYLRWLAPRFEEVRKGLDGEIAELRRKATSSSQHKRTPTIMANLGVGLRWFQRFARETGVLDESEADQSWTRCWAALGVFAEAQAEHVRAADPVGRFLELLVSALSSGRAHLAGASGGEPDDPGAWGWREVTVGTGDYARDEWRPQGDRVGWLDGDDLYLDPPTAYRIAQAMVGPAGDGIPVGDRTLWKRLKERHILQSIDEQRQTLKVRRDLEGHRRGVLHLRISALYPSRNPTNPTTEQDEPRSLAVKDDSRSGLRSGLRSGSGHFGEKPDHRTRPQTPLTPPGGAEDPDSGRVGRVSEEGREPKSETPGPPEPGRGFSGATKFIEPVGDQSHLRNQEGEV